MSDQPINYAVRLAAMLDCTNELKRDVVILASVLIIKWGQDLKTRQHLADAFQSFQGVDGEIVGWEEQATRLEVLRQNYDISDEEVLNACRKKGER